MLRLKPDEFRDIEIGDFFDMYDAYVYSIFQSNDNTYFASLSYRIASLENTVASAFGSKAPFKSELKDFMLKSKEYDDIEAIEEALHG